MKSDRIVSSYLTSASNPAVVKTRPNYPYPNIARYSGSGDINNAASFVKSAPDVVFDDNNQWIDSGKFRADSARALCAGRKASFRSTLQRPAKNIYVLRGYACIARASGRTYVLFLTAC